MRLAKGMGLLFLFVIAQSFIGKWMLWSRVMPEGDFACLVLLSLSLGRFQGTCLGGILGWLRGTFSPPAALGIFVLSGIGFLSGTVGERRTLRWRWQKLAFLFVLFVVSDTLFFLLGQRGPFPLQGFWGYGVQSLFPSALLSTLIGFWVISFLPEGSR